MAKKSHGEPHSARGLQDRILTSFLGRLDANDRVPAVVAKRLQKLVEDNKTCEVDQIVAAIRGGGETDGENPTT